VIRKWNISDSNFHSDTGSPVVFLSLRNECWVSTLIETMSPSYIPFSFRHSQHDVIWWCAAKTIEKDSLNAARISQSALVQRSARSLTFCILCQGKNPKLLCVQVLLLTGSCKVEDVSEGFPVVEPAVPCARTRLTPHQACLICKRNIFGKKSKVTLIRKRGNIV
jgi:hypothetical protein